MCRIPVSCRQSCDQRDQREDHDVERQSIQGTDIAVEVEMPRQSCDVDIEGHEMKCDMVGDRGETAPNLNHWRDHTADEYRRSEGNHD